VLATFLSLRTGELRYLAGRAMRSRIRRLVPGCRFGDRSGLCGPFWSVVAEGGVGVYVKIAPVWKRNERADYRMGIPFQPSSWS
jgi:hypothetical protein